MVDRVLYPGDRNEYVDLSFDSFIVFDSFTGQPESVTTHTPEKDTVGTGWNETTAYGDGFTVSHGKLQGGPGEEAAFFIDAGISNVTFSIDITPNDVESTSTNYRMAVAASAAPWIEDGYVGLIQWSGVADIAILLTKDAVIKFNSGVIDTWVNGETKNMKISNLNGVINIYLDDSLVATWTEDGVELTGTRVSLYLNDYYSSGITYVDNVQVY
jgi:hypothetical protein